jgi:hypothetical protein
VGEAKPGPVRLGDQHPGGGCLLQQDGYAGRGAQDLRQQPWPQPRPVESGYGEHPDARLGQPGQPAVDHLPHRVHRCGARPAAAGCCPGLLQAAQLTDEQRVAAGAGVHGRGGLPGDRGAGDLRHQFANAGGVETLQPGDRGCCRDATETVCGIVVPVGARQQQSAHGQLARGEFQQPQRVRVGPVQVIEHDQQSALGRNLGEMADHPVEDPEPVRRLARHPGSGRGEVLLAAGQALRGPQHLGPRPEPGHSLALGATAPRHPHSASSGLVGESGDKRGLADSWLAGDQHQRPVPRQRRIQRFPEPGQHRTAADQGRWLPHRRIIPEKVSVIHPSKRSRGAAPKPG